MSRLQRALFTNTLLSLIVLTGLFLPLASHAQEEQPATTEQSYRAKVLTHKQNFDELGQVLQQYEVRFLDGPKKGQVGLIGDNESVTATGTAIYQPGDVVHVAVIHHIDGTDRYLILDSDRQWPLLWLAFIFVAGIAWFSRWRGVRSLIALAFSLVVIIWWLVPLILQGYNPVTTTLAASAAVLIVSFILDTGFRRATWAAALGTVVTMSLVGLISRWAIYFTHLTGNNSEEALYLQNIGANPIDIRGLLLAGILIGTLGILDDMAVAQVSVVGELRRANPRMSGWEVYRSAMRVGHGHMAAIVNTLVFAYAGSALPLMLLFSGGTATGGQIINNEIIATEIVRSIVGSLGLILALPITTAAAVWIGVKSVHGKDQAHHHLQ